MAYKRFRIVLSKGWALLVCSFSVVLLALMSSCRSKKLNKTVEPEPVEEYVEEPYIEPEPEPVAEPEPEVEEQELSMEDIFNSVSNGLMKMEFDEEDDSRLDVGYGKPSKKKKKKKGIEIEYDPDSDSTTVRRRHKRGDDAWGW